MDYDAILRDYTLVPYGERVHIAFGNVYQDSKGRFSDGEAIRTSIVKRVIDIDGDKYAVTLNTVYLLENPLEAVASKSKGL